MKKLLALLFTAAVVFSLTMPVYAQDTSSQDTTATKEKKAKKTHAAKTKKAKKTEEAGTSKMRDTEPH